MKNSVLQKSLIELEESLKNLETARSQVDKVTSKSEKIISAFSDILNLLEAIQNEFDEGNLMYQSVIEKSVNGFSTIVKEKVTDFNEKASDFNNNLASVIDKVFGSITELQKTIDESTLKIETFDFGKRINELHDEIKQKNTELNKSISLQMEAMRNKQKKQSIFMLVVMVLGFISIIVSIFLLK